MVLAVATEAALIALLSCLVSAGMPLVPVYEPDSPWNGALMAIGIVPRKKEELRRHLSALPLLR